MFKQHLKPLLKINSVHFLFIFINHNQTLLLLDEPYYHNTEDIENTS